MRGRHLRLLFLGTAALFALAPQQLLACAACFGRSDSKLAEGMNMGIFTLLVVILCVLGGFGAFFVYLARRSANAAAAGAVDPLHGTKPDMLS